MAPGKHHHDPYDPHDLPRRTAAVPPADLTDEVEAVLALRAASDQTGPLEIITPDMLARVRSGLVDEG